jgi:uncharacterized protein
VASEPQEQVVSISRVTIEEFVAQRKLAVVGVSRSAKRYGAAAYRELKAKGYQLYPVHPEAESVIGDRCFPSLAALPEPVDGVLVIVPPAQAERVVEEAITAGIRRIWLQRGAESEAALERCKAAGISVVHGECILMFAGRPGFPHNVHRFFRSVFGGLPK